MLSAQKFHRFSSQLNIRSTSWNQRNFETGEEIALSLCSVEIASETPYVMTDLILYFESKC
jgi:hypothetical protein